MKELAIGEVAVINGKKVKCVEEHGDYCIGCAFEDCGCPDMDTKCYHGCRKDGTDVHFEKVD